MVNIKKQLVSTSIANQRSYGKGNRKKYIVVHQTGNTTRGAGAQAHANLQSRLNPRQASWHFSVDDKEIIQSFEEDYHCWHAGVGPALGNYDTLGIEACINIDSDYIKTLLLTAKLVAYLMKKYDIPLENVTQHNKWDGKNCPAQIRAGKDGVNWNRFLNMVKEVTPGATKPVEDKKEVEVVVSTDKLFRVQIGAFANQDNAKRLAEELKAKGYPVFLPDAAMVAPATDIKKAPAKSIETLAREVLAGEHGNGQERRTSLGGQFEAVQNRVDEIVAASKRKSNEEIARDILYTKHKWGNGKTRETRLRAEGYDPRAIQAIINRLA